MTRVKISGSWLTEENEIRVGVVNAFKNLLFATGGWRPNISDLSFARLEAVEATKLEEPFFFSRRCWKLLRAFVGTKRLGLMAFLWPFSSFLRVL